MKTSDYLALVAVTEEMNPTEGEEIGIEKKCRTMLREAISIKADLISLKEKATDDFEIGFLEREIEKIELNQQTLERRLTQAGSMIGDDRVNAALNHVEAIRQSMHILLYS